MSDPVTEITVVDVKSETVESEQEQKADVIEKIDPVVDQHIQTLLKTIQDVLKGQQITPALVVRVVAQCVQTASKIKVKGSQKKELVKRALDIFIKEASGLDPDQLALVQSVIDVILDDTIETLVEVTKKLSKGCCF